LKIAGRERGRERLEEKGEEKRRAKMILSLQVNLSHGRSDAALNICPPGSTLLLYSQEESIKYI